MISKLTLPDLTLIVQRVPVRYSVYTEEEVEETDELYSGRAKSFALLNSPGKLPL